MDSKTKEKSWTPQVLILVADFSFKQKLSIHYFIKKSYRMFKYSYNIFLLLPFKSLRWNLFITQHYVFFRLLSRNNTKVLNVHTIIISLEMQNATKTTAWAI